MTPPQSFQLDTETITHGVTRLPSLSAVVLELLASINDDTTDAITLAHKIAHDQAMVARLLRIANSSFYGLQGKVNSVQEAVIVLGLQQVRMLATAISVASSFKKPPSSDFDFRAFWFHAMLTALTTRELARHLRLPEENAFVAGLLHDIGRLVLASSFPAHMTEITQYQKQADCSVLEAEQSVLGTDHAHIGLILAEHWGFPRLLCDAIAGHHTPDTTERRSITALVHIANAIAHALDLAGAPLERVPPISEACWNGINLSDADLQHILGAVEQQFASIREALFV